MTVLVLLEDNARVRSAIATQLRRGRVEVRAPDFLIDGVVDANQTPLMDDSKMVLSMIGSGTPVLLEFQSPYCISCTQIAPIVDQLEQELSAQISIGPQLHVIRVNIQDKVGKELGSVYGFQATPTFIFFDAQGNELWRQIGNFDPQMVHDSLK